MNISLEMVNSILGILGSIVGILCSFYPIIKSSPMVKVSDEHIPHTTALSQYSKITSEKVFATGWAIYTLSLIVIGGILGPHKFFIIHSNNKYCHTSAIYFKNSSRNVV